MEAVGIALSVAQTLFAALQSTQLKEICSIFGKESELVEFQNTVDTVKAVLLDADNKDNIPDNKTRLYIQQLKDVVYDADDLLDEFVTLAEQIQQIKGGKAYEKVRHFFSSRNPLAAAYNMSRGVKKIRKKLDAIASNHSKFDFCVDSEPIRRRRAETCSYVYEGNIVGREDDVKKIIGLLLDDSNMKENVSFLTIVGIGGLGKTALAQLVFSDKKLKSAFPLRLWTCVSDHDQEQLDVHGILRNILASDIGKKDEELTMDQVQKQLREKLAINRYVLVLDDVWTENHNQWQKLIEFLLGGQKGSWILVTTRSHETATIVGGGQVHKLQGLSKENSWLLFEKIAFGVERSSTNEELVKIGREIVEQCAGVPLAIRVAGSLLFGQDTSKWLSFQKIGLSNLRGSQTDIMLILKLSYNQLEPSLKSCFTYCALFPKDFEMRKELLINLWMAQGFIVPLEGQKVEDVAEEYFSILLRRCFFQDVSHDAYSFEIISCKMHDLMHDMAQNIAGKEIICAIDSVINNIDERVRHLALMSNESGQYSFTKSHIRSLIFIGRWDCWLQQASVEALVASCVCLRVLDLKKLVLKSLPDSIGNLWHLRFLDVSFNHELEVLPKSITKLYNLETLRLTGCSKLKELPEDVIKLVKLRILDVFGCSSLTHMPRGMSKLSCIHTLGRFAVKSPCWKQMFDELEELKGLKGLKGRLHINISLPWNNDLDINEGNIKEGAYLRNKEHIDEMIIEFNGIQHGEEALRLMEELQPNSNLKILELREYDSVRMPSWARGNKLKTFLPNLISLELTKSRIKYMTCVGDMPHLKSLIFNSLEELEYMIDDRVASTGRCEPTASTTTGLSTIKGPLLFPSLENLELHSVPKLKGWRRSGLGVEDNGQLFIDNGSNMERKLLLPQLTNLGIRDCPSLECNLFCPVLKHLELLNFNKRLEIRSTLSQYLSVSHNKEIGDEKGEATNSDTLASSSSSFSSLNIPKLRKIITIDDVEWLLNSQPLADVFPFIKRLRIVGDEEVESLGMAMSKFTALSSIYIRGCPRLRSVSRVLEHLTSLKHLCIVDCPNMSLAQDEREDGIDIGMPFPSLSHSLRELIWTLPPQLVDLPNWIKFLHALEELSIYGGGLESLPNWMSKLTSLKRLRITFCSPRLEERCQDPTGEDWPLIQHIPFVRVSTWL